MCLRLQADGEPSYLIRRRTPTPADLGPNYIEDAVNTVTSALTRNWETGLEAPRHKNLGASSIEGPSAASEGIQLVSTPVFLTTRQRSISFAETPPAFSPSSVALSASR